MGVKIAFKFTHCSLLSVQILTLSISKREGNNRYVSKEQTATNIFSL